MKRFNIPNLTPLWEEVREFVLEHQGDKGFIDTRNEGNDTIWCFCYDDDTRHATDVELLGIRVRSGDVEVLPNFDDLDIFKDTEDLNESLMWHSLKSSDVVYYIPTLFNIAESIEEYI